MYSYAPWVEPGPGGGVQGCSGSVRLVLPSTPTRAWVSRRDSDMTSLNATSPAPSPLAEAMPALNTALPAQEWLVRRIGVWSWRLHPSWSFLLEPNAPDWSRLEDDPRAVEIKSNDGRQVWRVELERGLVFVKVARPARKWPRLRRRLFGSDAARECRVAAYAAAHGVETIRTVACGEAPIEGRQPTSILITIGLPRSRPLSEVWSGLDPDDPQTRGAKNEIIEEVARLLATAHQNGFEHYDLHSGNVLLDESQGRFRPMFVDLHSVRVGRSVPERAVIRNLAQFNQWFRLHAPLTDRIRFLDQYLHWREITLPASAFGHRLESDRVELLDRLEEAARTHANALYGKRDRRVLRSGRYFARLRLGNGWRAHVFLEAKHPVAGSRASQMVFTAQQWRSWLSDPLRWIRPGSPRDVLKDSATATVCRARLPHPDGELDIVCKRASQRSPWKRLQTLVRRSRPMATWRRGNALLHRQILTARPLAVLERRRLGFMVDSMLVTEGVEHAIDLDTLLTVTLRGLPEARGRWLKLRVLDGLVTATKTLLERGFRHRDFKAPNIIVQWDPDSGVDPRIVLVDLDGVLPLRGSAESAGRQMLMRLNVSLDHCRRVTRTDRLRFLKRYLSRYGCPTAEWKPLWRELARMSQHKRQVRDRHQQRKFAKYGRF